MIDQQRYPLEQADGTTYRALVQHCQQNLAADGMFNLPGFLSAETAAHIAGQLLPQLRVEAFTHSRRHNIYFQPNIPDLPANHPALLEFETTNHTLCADQMANNAIVTLYYWQPLIDFLAQVMGKPALYPMDDPLASVNVMAYHAGEGLNWHFDRAEFTITLLLQAPQSGGGFEYRKDLRSVDKPNYAGVGQLLRGEDAAVKQLILAPGTLNVFRGVNTAHRVTPVVGDAARMIAVFSYFDRPGVRFTAEEQVGFYGRMV